MGYFPDDDSFSGVKIVDSTDIIDIDAKKQMVVSRRMRISGEGRVNVKGDLLLRI